MMWLAATPRCVVNAHLEMLGRLQAEELLGAATATGCGSGLKPGRWIRRQMARWRRAARGRVRATPVRAGDLRGLGIGLRTVKRDG
jgi:hypothetical protein